MTHPTQDNTLGAAWMREQAASAAEDHGEPSCYQAMSKEFREGYEDAGRDIAIAIRTLPLPTDTDLRAEAMKLPEVAALVGAISDAIDANPTELDLGNYNHDDVCRLQNEAIDVWQILSATLAPFTAAKETP